MDWRCRDDVHTVATAFKLPQQALSRSALGELTIDFDEVDIAVITHNAAHVGHRVDSDPATGVVDAWLAPQSSHPPARRIRH
jgi:hypothetical protein